MTLSTTTEIQALTSKGALIRKFEDAAQAFAWQDTKGHAFPGSSLVTVLTTVSVVSTPLCRSGKGGLRLVRAA